MFSHFVRRLRSVGEGNSQPTVFASGFHWHLEPAAIELFGDVGPDFAAWERAGCVQLVKQNLQRTISRVTLPNGVVYVKHCRANTPRSWAREVLRPAKARLEFDNAVSLHHLGINTIEPLAWGTDSKHWPGESCIITREQFGAVPFVDYLETQLRPWIRQIVTRQFARYVAKLIFNGIIHPDPHPGNFLIDVRDPLNPTFYLMDLHAMRIGPITGVQMVLDNLVLLNRWFQVRATRTDRLRFWRAYRSARTGLNATDPTLPKQIESATRVSNNRFWTARLSRYCTNNRDSFAVNRPGIVGYVRRDVPDEFVENWLNNLDGLFTQPDATLLKDSRSSTVAVVPIGNDVVIAKRFHLKAWVAVVKNLVRPSPALRSWLFGNNLLDRGLPTARPLAVFLRRKFGVSLTGYVLFEHIPDALGLPEAVIAAATLPERLAIMRAWAERLGRLLRIMHDHQVSHRDLKAPNILMRNATKNLLSAEPVLIDLVGVEVGREVPVAVRIRDLARLNASFVATTTVTRSDRLRVLQSYFGWRKPTGADWKIWWREIAFATQSKVEKNERNGRPLG